MAYLQYRPTQTLFQYTSTDGFLGILRSKRLRLSDLRASNDPRELELGYERLMQALRTLLDDERQSENREGLSRLISSLAGYFERQQAFCCCFTLAVDELPMWGAYGQSYSGLAIGFRPSAILGIPGRVQQVQYLDAAQDKKFEELARNIAADVELYRNSKDILPWISAGANAVSVVMALKHQIWAYEKEIRIVYVQRIERPEGTISNFPVSKMPGGEPLFWREPLERTAGTRAVKYVEFPFGRFRDGKFDPARSIKTVIVGPNCSLSIAAVEAELKEQGFYDCVVKKSDCLIRV
jgi:hypothetical protein